MSTDLAHSHLDGSSGYVRLMIFDIFCVLTTIRPHILRDKLGGTGVNSSPGSQTTRRVNHCFSDWRTGCQTVLSSTGMPQGTVLVPFLFNLYTSDFQYHESRHIQKYSDDTDHGVCSDLLYMFYKTSVDSNILYALACLWGQPDRQENSWTTLTAKSVQCWAGSWTQ